MSYRTFQLPPVSSLDDLTQLVRDFSPILSQSRLCAIDTGTKESDLGKNLLIVDDSKTETAPPTLRQFPGALTEAQLAAEAGKVETAEKMILRSYGNVLLGASKTWLAFFDPATPVSKPTQTLPTPLEEAKIRQTEDNFLNVRNGPGMKKDVVDQLPAGTVVQIYARDDIWRKIDPAQERWVSSLFLSPIDAESGDTSSAAVQPVIGGALTFDLPEPKDGDLGEHHELWGTYYYPLKTQEDSKGIRLVNGAGKAVGPQISQKSWCLGSMEGTILVIDGTGKFEVYNYEGKGTSQVTSCSAYFPSLSSGVLAGTERVTWQKAKGPFGDGAGSFLLSPFRTLAVDKSQFPLGTAIYIPEARGVSLTLPDGSSAKHDGYFFAGDVGGAIKGNHVDFFLGVSSSNPFKFVQSKASSTFPVRVVTNQTIIDQLKKMHS